MTPNVFFEINGFKVFLSEEAKNLTGPQLFKKAKEYGLEVSMMTLVRAKKRGYFFMKYHRIGFFQRKGNIGFIQLSPAERGEGVSIPTIMKVFGVAWNTAKKAKDRGWFEVTTSNIEKITDLATERIVPSLEGGE